MTLPTSETLRERAPSRQIAEPRAGSAPRRRLPPPIPPLVMATEAENERRRHWESVYGMLCSLAVHAILILGLALLVFESSDHEVGSLLGVLSQNNGDPPAEFILDSEFNPDAGGSEDPVEIASPSVVFSDSGLATPNSVKAGGGVGTGEGAGEGDGVGVTVPTLTVPGYAVTKGSFSAWTEPKDPAPGEHYFITIQVRLPSHLQKGKVYPVKDISGLVTGTDGYKKVIRFKPTDKVEVQDGVVQFQLLIPGAAKLVRDTIRIESKLLKEKQTIQLVF